MKRLKGADITILVGAIICALGGLLTVAGMVATLRSTPEVSSEPARSSQGTTVNQIVVPSEPKEAGVEADDGELHDATNTDVSYTFSAETEALDGIEHLDAYDMDVKCVFKVSYPQVSDDVPQAEEVNSLLKRTALATMDAYYTDPSAETVKMIRTLMADNTDSAPLGADALLSSVVTYAVSYNSEDLLSVCFSDEYYLGADTAGFIALRTVNINLKTGETYELADVLTVDEALATSFVDNLVQESGTDENDDGVVTESECLEVALVGRETLIEGLQGRGELAEGRMNTCLFIDGNGQPNLGATYWVSGVNGFVRGWWDVTITDEQLEATRKDSSLWELLGK